ncbi:hypothetical protein Tco_0973367 [Tanacetum coccineum]
MSSTQQQIIPSPPQQSYEPPVTQQQSPAPSTQLDLRFIVPLFLPIDDPITSLNKNGKAIGTWVINTVRDVKENQPRKMSLAQAQEARVILQEEQQDLLADDLEDLDLDCDDLQLHTTSIFKADHVDAFDSVFDEAPTASAIFMARLSPAGVSGFGIGEVALSTLDVLQRFGLFLQMGFTLILATLDGLDVGLLGDVMMRMIVRMMIESVFIVRQVHPFMAIKDFV